jgi:hypothetical protein
MRKYSYLLFQKDNITYLKWALFGSVIYFYGLYLRRNILMESNVRDIDINIMDVTLNILSDMYLIIYFIFPITLYLITKTIINEFEYTILIRLQSYRKWIFSVHKKIAGYLLLIQVIWFVISILVSLGLPVTFSWSEMSQIKAFTNDVSFILSDYFTYPIFALISQLLLFYLTIIVIQLILSILYVIIKSKYLVISSCVSLFLLAILSFKIFPSWMNIVSLPNYLSLYHGVYSFDSPIISILVVTAFLIISNCFTLYIDRNFNGVKKVLSKIWPCFFFAMLVLMGMIYTSTTFIDENFTIWDVWIQTFYGVSSQGFIYMPYLNYLITFWGFIYFVQLFFQKELTELTYYKVIRFQSLNKWFLSWFKYIILFIILFLIVLLFCNLAIGYIFGFSIELKTYIYSDLSIVTFLYHFFVNGFLQVLFYILLVFIISWLTKETLNSFILFCILSVLMFPGINTLNIIPVGLNSLNYIILKIDTVTLTYTLLIYILFEVLIVYYILNKRNIE